MTASVTVPLHTQRRWGLGLLIPVLLALTIVRLIGLKFSLVDLFVDEAQYWSWSHDLAFGYFSKPPLLAWTIALAEHVCGASEACIRSPAPIIYFATSLVTYAAARVFYDDRTAFWAALLCALAPGTVFSARIISTDVPLLLFWALALFGYLKLLADPRPRWGIVWGVVLGVALGLGLLAKYAMIYFLLGVGLAAMFDRDARGLLRNRSLWLAFVIGLAVILPNIVWNVANGFVTFKHVGENIDNNSSGFNLLRMPEFLASQFAIFGPITFAVLLIAIARVRSSTITRADRLMLAFAIPPLLLITAASLTTKVYANWAATSFISASILAAAILVRRAAWRALIASVAIGLVVQVALLAGDAVATQVGLPRGFGGDAYHRTLGWRTLGEISGRLAQKIGARSLASENRNVVAALTYYWRDQPQQILQWPSGGPAQFDLTRGVTAASPEPILLIAECPYLEPLQRYYATVVPLGRIDTPTGPTSQRSFVAFALSGRRGPIGPLAPCEPGIMPPQLSHPVAVP